MSGSINPSSIAWSMAYFNSVGLEDVPKTVVSDIVLQKEAAINPSKPENLVKAEKLFIELKDKLKYNEKIRQYITQNKECLLEKIQEKDKIRPRKQKIVMSFPDKSKSNNRSMSR